MADFRDLRGYQMARQTNKDIFLLSREPKVDRAIRDQLGRASTSILLNIAEGSGRFSIKEKKHFFIIARASALECQALFDVMEDIELLSPVPCEDFCQKLSEVSKMLFGLIKNLEGA